MASEIDVINDALGELGEPTIVARTDDTAQAIAANRFFDQAKEELLEEHTWRFATKAAELAQNATAPPFKYLYSFQQPSDFNRLIEVNETNVDNVIVPLYELVGDEFWTNETSLKIQYVYNAPVSVFSPGAARALAFKMGAKMARVLPDSATQKQEMLSEYKDALKKAKSVDSMHQRQPIENRAAYSGFVQSMAGGGYPNPTVTPTNY